MTRAMQAYAAVDRLYDQALTESDEDKLFWQAIQGTVDDVKNAFETKNLGALMKGADEIHELIIKSGRDWLL